MNINKLNKIIMINETLKNKEEKVLKIRGTGKIDLAGHTFEFTPQGTGQPAQRDVKKYGNAKVYTTTGKEPKRVITLQCAEDATDPYSEMTDQFARVMKSEYQKPVPDAIKPKGVVLKNTDDLRMTVNRTSRMLEVSFRTPLDPQEKRDYKTMFYEKIQEISKCFAINETTILKSR